MNYDENCDKPCKARESLPDILDSIRRAKTHAHYADDQLRRLERAYGEERTEPPKQQPLDHEPSFIEIVEGEATELADFLLTLQEQLRYKLDLLFGDRA